MKIIIVLLVLLFATPVFAKQQYNAFENRWETVPDNSNWSPRYNAFENDWSVQPQDAKVEYNPFENTWDWNRNYENKKDIWGN